MRRGTQSMLARRRFDVDDYHRMARAGILHEDDRVELIDGEIVQMTAIGSRHASCVSRLLRSLVRAVGDRALVSPQNPLRLDRYSEPEPDVTLLRPREDDYAEAHPSPEDVLLLVEVAESSLSFDCEIKLPLYAAAGIREVWIVDLTDEAVEVYRELEGESYGDQQRLATGSISPVALPDLTLDIHDVLPPAA